MRFNPDKHHRRSIRLKGHDYSRPGTYYVTICVQDRKCLFGHIIDGEMHLNEYGKIVQTEWLKSSEIRNEIELDVFVVMPNQSKPHNLTIGKKRFQNQGKNTLSSIIGSYKSAVTKHSNRLGFNFAWQSRFNDHIIRDYKSHQSIKPPKIPY